MSCLKLVSKFQSNECCAYFINVLNAIARRSLSNYQDKEECEETKNLNCSAPPYPCKPEYAHATFQPVFEAPISMWENPDCCNVIKCEPLCRFDVDCLKSSTHWTERKYQRTWFECPKVIKKKKYCLYEKLNVPPPEIRPRGVGNPNAKWDRNFSDCLKIEKYEKPCPPCSKRTDCKRRLPQCCFKRCTLYPSYSECCKRPSKSPPPHECLCLAPISLCEVNKYITDHNLTEKDLKR